MTTVTACDDLFLLISSRTRDTVINREKPSQVVTAVTEVRLSSTVGTGLENSLTRRKKWPLHRELGHIECHPCASANGWRPA